jgi:phospholipid/cholesterol/gamma-HCH transport system substrate-binding protein
MLQRRSLEMIVGLFMLAGVIAFLVLALKVSGLTNEAGASGYFVTAAFDNIGDLKPRAPVTISGVHIGQVISIKLNPETFRADVTMLISKKYNELPSDSSAQILTQGLLGSNYISLIPGFQNAYLKNGSKIIDTHPALILENLIGQLLFKVSNNDKKKG